jgi:hypothetical protein
MGSASCGGTSTSPPSNRNASPGHRLTSRVIRGLDVHTGGGGRAGATSGGFGASIVDYHQRRGDGRPAGNLRSCQSLPLAGFKVPRAGTSRPSCFETRRRHCSAGRWSAGRPPELPQEPAIGDQRLSGLAGVDNSTGIHQRCEGNLGQSSSSCAGRSLPTRLDRGSR